MRKYAHMDTLQTKLSNVERRAGSAGLTIHQLLTRADLHPSTWRRWRAGTTKPNFSSWDRIEEALEGLSQ